MCVTLMFLPAVYIVKADCNTGVGPSPLLRNSWSQPCTISPEPIQTRPEVWSSQLTDREQHLAWWLLLLQSLQWLSQYALLLWPYRKDQEEFSLRNRDDSVNDASRNSDGTVNPGQEIANKKRYVLILAEVKQKKSQEAHQ